MLLHEPGSINYYTFDSFDPKGLTHAIFTRRGGVSPDPWSSLNVGGLRGDDPARVLENKTRCFQVLGRKIESAYEVYQVHSADVVCVKAPRPDNVSHIKADAILTDQPGVSLFMRFADCVPILLYDPFRHVIGVAHAGWLGTVRGIIKASVTTMHSVYQSNPENILAAIGPSIGPHHYEVGRDVISRVQETFGNDSSYLLKRAHPLSSQSDTHFFDLWTANRLLLEQSGVKQIEEADLCTACHPEDWYSHRGEHGQTGRFGVLIAL